MLLKEYGCLPDTDMPWIGKDNGSSWKGSKIRKEDDPFARRLLTDSGKVIIAFIAAVTTGIVLIMALCYIAEKPAAADHTAGEEIPLLRESASVTFNKNLSLFQGDIERPFSGAGEEVTGKGFSARIADAVVLKPSKEYSPSEENRLVLCAVAFTNTSDGALTLMPSENAFSARRIKGPEKKAGLNKAEGKIGPGESLLIGFAFDAPQDEPVSINISGLLYGTSLQEPAVLDIK